jgi:hypothetical protein
MFWQKEGLSGRIALTIALFLIGALHTMIFTIFQIPENFLMGKELPLFGLTCKVLFYASALGIGISHQSLCHRFGLRKTLYFGLLCNFVGLAILLLNQSISNGEGLIPLILLDMLFFGMALTSVINALVTYIVIEYPKKVGLGIVALFAFFNLGDMLAPLVIDISHVLEGSFFVYYLLMVLLGCSIWFIHVRFFDPPLQRARVQMKKGSVIWRLLHYRLGLFVLAIICYGLAETTFNIWGHVQVKTLFGELMANEAISFFWLFLILGQIFLLIPLYFIPAQKIFYFLALIVMSAAFYFPLQNTLFGLIVWLAIAGFGSSAVFPILLSQMEKEILPFAQGHQILPYIEKSISLMNAGYILGIGIIDFWVELVGSTPYFSLVTHFHFAIAFMAVTTLISMFLSHTKSR